MSIERVYGVNVCVENINQSNCKFTYYGLNCKKFDSIHKIRDFLNNHRDVLDYPQMSRGKLSSLARTIQCSLVSHFGDSMGKTVLVFSYGFFESKGRCIGSLIQKSVVIRVGFSIAGNKLRMRISWIKW